jgi:hypothetical protein
LFTSSNDLFTNKKKLTLVSDFVYKPIQGDEVDRMFALTLVKLGYQIPAKRLGGGYYTLGSKKIFCKIISQRLVVRVGGGFMAIEEFLDQYGQFEADKYSVQ